MRCEDLDGTGTVKFKKMKFGISLLILSFISIAYGDEVSDNTVELKFYRLTKSLWVANNFQTTFSGIIAEGATNYCTSNPSACLMTSCCSTNFKEQDIKHTSGYPEDQEKDMIHRFYIQYPGGANLDPSASYNNQTVLTSSVVIAIVTATREQIHTDIGYWITGADKEFYGIPPDDLSNSIIIPIAFVVLLAVIILAIVLHVWNKRREKAEKIQKKIEERKAAKKKAKVEPMQYHTPKDTDVPEVDKKINEKLYDQDSAARSMDSPRKSQGGASDADSAIRMDEGRNNFQMETQARKSLPPLSSEIDETSVHKKKEKKKKKKKHRSKQEGDDPTTEL
ncbi:hypothetical protein FSP39_004805 [Pinctada imbricata]|uniref:DUF8077 domain-containing protein n=1 Tax=Pinctada imbricata TaxID=66713 RepID=A0AA88XL04_PINIB|nr:hypothetical protein FSP39_004805 [Pinctada imbricata]